MNMLKAIYEHNEADHERNWGRDYVKIPLWEDDKNWEEINRLQREGKL